MNKLEQAIRKSTGDDSYLFPVFNNTNTSIVENITKMENRHSLENKALENKKIIFPAMKNKALLNSFRDLRTALTINSDKNVIMVTSICKQSGASFFARNIATATAFDISKTAILLDCNVDKNDVAELFELEGRAGVINFIFDTKIETGQVIHDSGVKRLRVIPFGVAMEDLGEHLYHPRFQELISQLKHKYTDRYIFIDAPPIIDSADARILMRSCDQVVLVVPYGKGNVNKIQAATNIIGKDKLSGVVFNKFAK